MIIAVFSDVHGNLPALERFVKATRRLADKYICLGDVVDYGPWNDECLQAVHSLPGIVLLEGNHERLFLGVDPPDGELPLVQEFLRYSRPHFSRRDLIEGLPRTCRMGRFECRHTIGGKRIYANTAIRVARDYVIGHSHYQYVVRRPERLIVNPGSVGQNRAVIDMVDYALYNTNSGEITLCSEPYPFRKFMKELKVRGYSERCAGYYLNKLKSTRAASA